MKLYNYFTAFILLCWLIIIYFVAVTAIPYNPVTIDKGSAFKLKMLLPEGWNFFTRDPREVRTYIYLISKDGSLVPLSNWPNNSLRNLMGIKRTARGIGTDYGMILYNVSDSMWSKSTVNEFHKVISEKRPLKREIVTRYSDGTNQHFLFGNVLFIQKEILPWSWFKSDIPTNLPLKYIHVFIQNN